jgi:hypothetical protein
MLEINFDMAERFLSAYDDTLDITFQIFDDSKKTGRAEHFTANFETPHTKKYLKEANLAGCGIYYMLNKGDGNGRSNSNVTHLRALVADLDGAPLSPVMSCPVEPTFIIESSKGRYQCHWLINPISIEDFGSFEEAKNKFAAYQVSIARKFAGDESVKDLSRVFRIPGFYHQKESPFMSKIIEHNHGAIYKLSDLVEKLQLSEILSKVESEAKESLSDVDTLLQRKIKLGSRHSTLLAYASKYAHQMRLGYNERKWILEGLNNAACEKPIDARDLERINVQAGRYAAEERNKNETVDISALIEKHKVMVAESSQDPIPDYLLQPKGLVGEMFNYILRSSIKPQPELALAAAFTACGAVMGRKVRTETNIRTNIFCLSLIETGGGKDWPRQAIKRLFHAAGKPQRASIEDAASDAAVSESLRITPSQVFLLDEFGRFMKSVVNKNAGIHLSNIPTLLMKLYSSAGSSFFTKAYADTKQNHVIHQPHVCLLATSVERNFYSAITKEYVDDGLLNRILFFQSTDPDPQIRKVQYFDPPESLVNAFKNWEAFGVRNTGGNLDNLESCADVVCPEPRIVPFQDGAEEIFNDMESDLRVRRKSLRIEGLSGLFTRVYENAQKVALIVACGENPFCPEISVANAEYACNLVSLLTNNLLKAVTKNVFENRVEATHETILNIIKASGANGITKKDLCKKGYKIGLRRTERDEIIKELVEYGYVFRQEIQGVTKPIEKFFFSVVP